MNDKVCENCRHFDPFSEGATRGVCRLNPPVVLGFTEDGDTKQARPEMYAYDTCGQHVSRTRSPDA